jgi:hypothetical protein
MYVSVGLASSPIDGERVVIVTLMSLVSPELGDAKHPEDKHVEVC